MKIFTKICLIISVICICTAAVCFGVGAALGSGIKEVQQLADKGELNIGNWKIGKGYFYYGEENKSETIETESGKMVTSVESEKVENLDIEIQYGEVYIVDSDSNEITVHIDAPEPNQYHCKIENTTLKLKDKTSSYKWNVGLSDKSDVTITIGIPAGKEFDEVKLTANYGIMEITHTFVTKEMEIQLDAGELNGSYLEALDEFSIDVGAGSLAIGDLKTNTLDVECGVGEITMALAGNEKDYDYEISCGMGSVYINDKSFSSLSIEKHIDNNADKKISLDCGMGEINIIVKED